MTPTDSPSRGGELDLRWWLLLIMVVAAALRFSLALALPYDGGTDERRRYPTAAYLYQHGRVPRLGASGAADFVARPVLPYRIAAWVAHLAPPTLPLYVRLRFAATLAGLLAIPLAYGCCRNLFARDRWLALALAAIVAFHPQFLYVGSYLNADAYTVTVNILVLYLCTVIHRQGGRLTMRSAVALGAALGLVFLGRQNGYVGFVLAAAYGVYLLRVNWRRNLSLLGVSLAVFLVFPTAFYLNQYRSLGIAYVPLAVGSGVAWVPPGWSVAEAYEQLAPRSGLDYPVVRADWRSPSDWFLFFSWLLPSSFGVFGYMDVLLPALLYSWYVGFIVGGLVGLIRWLRHARGRADRGCTSRRWLLGSCALTSVGMLAVVIAHSFAVLYQPQGRYLLPTLAPAVLLLVLGWRSLTTQPAFNQAAVGSVATFFALSGTYATFLLLYRAV